MKNTILTIFIAGFLLSAFPGELTLQNGLNNYAGCSDAHLTWYKNKYIGVPFGMTLKHGGENLMRLHRESC